MESHYPEPPFAREVCVLHCSEFERLPPSIPFDPLRDGSASFEDYKREQRVANSDLSMKFSLHKNIINLSQFVGCYKVGR